MFKSVLGILSGDGYAARAMRGSSLTILTFGMQNALRLGSNLILTRLLFPDAFGMVAIVTVVLTGASQFSDIGIRGSIVQDERGEDPDFLSTAWTMQIIRGFILGAVIFLLSGPLATFYETEQLKGLLRLAAIVPVIQGFNSTRFLSANRKIQFGRLTIVMFLSQFLGIVAMIVLAYLYENVWALMAGFIVPALVNAILSHVLLKGEVNWLHIDRDAAGRLLRFGRYIFFSTVALFIVNQGDRVVLGKFVTLSELAIYNIGYYLAAMPFLLGMMLKDRIIVPLYARRPPAESAHNRAQINKARSLITFGLLGVTGTLALIGDPLVRLLYDPRYHQAGAVTTLIALAFLPRLVTLTYEQMALAYGHSGRYASYAIVFALVQIVALLVGVSSYGLLGAILAMPVAVLTVYPLLIWIDWPYRGWDGRHDLIFGTVALLIAIGVLWFRWPTIVPLLP